ncbi:ABC transporter ATP-binding protein [Kistimonas scapharcae]|uniref:Quaternary amine transport ATP-binding protein n=1 Tax=Kistimonas scapharcae TaxID=1036133 RepID=A0ABP8V619_9GAMM
MIRTDKLTKIFDTCEGTVTAADQICMEVPEGEICVLLGPSGCGKTTTLKMINRIIDPTSGKVFINGEDTTDLDTVTLRRQIGYVIQQTGLFPNMTIEENICVVPKMLGWAPDKMAERAKELLDLVGLDPRVFMQRYPNELSGGQQQRVGVIRALAANPPVMLMDEPFGAIDPINREIIQDEFLRMQQELKKTVLFVSHDIDEAVKMADRIAIFRGGKLVQFDTPDHILAHPANKFVADFVGDDRTLKRLQLVRVDEVMETRPASVTPQDSIQHAIEVMEDRGHGCVVLVNEQEAPIGIVERKMVEGLKGTCGEHHEGLKAVISVDDNLRKVASLLYKHDATWLPCVDEMGRFRGEITQRGITHHLGMTYRNGG